MKTGRYTKAQIIHGPPSRVWKQALPGSGQAIARQLAGKAILRQAEGGVLVAELCDGHGMK